MEINLHLFFLRISECVALAILLLFAVFVALVASLSILVYGGILQGAVGARVAGARVTGVWAAALNSVLLGVF